MSEWNPHFTKLLEALEEVAKKLNEADPSGLFRKWYNWEKKNK